MGKIILCVGNRFNDDPHVHFIAEKVKALDSEARVVLLDADIDSNHIEINTGRTSKDATSVFVIVDGERIPAESITTVWYNWNPHPPATSDLQEFIAKDFASAEWGRIFRSLESYLSHARWVNSLASLDKVLRKPLQMILAQQVGLTVPKTVITNNPAAVEKLFDEADNGRVIFKTLNRLFIHPNSTVFTTEITREFLAKSASSLTKAPAIYQELVERSSDLRITVVGREVFVVRISSQGLDDEKNRLDWRRCQEKSELYSVVEIPESFKERLLEFHKRAGLVFAAYDFLERGDDFVFLEVNPCRAAWLWLENGLKLNITERIARYLLEEDETNGF